MNKISYKILLPLISVFILGFLYINYYIARTQIEFAREQLIRNARITTLSILSINMDHFIEKRYDDIQFYVVKARKANRDVKYIMILNKEGEAVVHTDTLRIGERFDRSAFDRAALKIREFTVRDMENNPNIFEVCTPMLAFGSEKEVLGILRIGISQKHIHETLYRLQKSIITVGVVVILLSVILFVGIVNITVLKPIGLLARGATRVASGDLDITLPVSSSDEIGFLSKLFNQMARNLKSSRENYRLLVENLPIGIYRNTGGPKGRFLQANRVLAHMFGYDTPEDFMKVSVAELYQDAEDRLMFVEKIKDLGSVRDMELRLKKRDGTQFYGSCTANVTYDDNGEIAWMDGVIEDISVRKNNEKQLEEYRNHLEKLVDERTAELLQAMGEAEKARLLAESANRAKSRFLANMSHELRTPLNAIMGFAQLLERSTVISETDRENIQIIKRSGEHLLTLINSVLDMAKIEAGKSELNMTAFNLHYTLGVLEEMFRIRANSKQLELNVICDPDVPENIMSDEGKLRQVLINLIGNAVKFTEVGHIDLIVGVKDVPERESDTIRLGFEVIDTGPGIDPKKIDRIFDAFVQVSDGRDGEGGTGLGLTICREYVKLLGGDIAIHNRPGQGTKVIFDIETKRVSGELVAESTWRGKKVIGIVPGKKARDGRPYHILVVDDNSDNRRILCQLLESVGLNFTAADCGEKAVEVYRESEPHLVFMDLRMPGMDGYETAKTILAISEKDSLSAPALIAVTASVFEDERQKVLGSGFNDFIRKPFKQAEIFSVLSEYLHIDLVYEESDTTDEASDRDTREQLIPWMKELEKELVEELKTALLKSDLPGIEKAMTGVRRSNPTLARELDKWMDDFAYDKILDLIKGTDG